jgi:hypothetical protein
MARTRVRWERVVTLAAAGVLGVGVAGHAGSAAGDAGTEIRTRPVKLQVHEVRAGETIWGIARDVVGPEGDPRPVVDAVIAANQLRDAEILVGQMLVVPPRP